MNTAHLPRLLSAAGYRSVRQFASMLAKEHPQTFGMEGDNQRSPNTLQMNIGDLFKGRELAWWRNRPEAVAAVAKALGVSPAALQLDRDQLPHLYLFDVFPELPALDLAKEERYHIAKPQLTSTDQPNTQVFGSLDYWLLGDGTNQSPQHLDWLQITDPAEFDLVTLQLFAGSRHTVLRVASGTLDSGVDKEVLQHRSSLILVLTEKVHATQLQTFVARAHIAPLLVISQHALPESGPDRARPKSQLATDARSVNCWAWVLQEDWRRRLLQWTASRLSISKIGSGLRSELLSAWLQRVDPDHYWFSQVGDVLQLCRVALQESAQLLNQIESHRLGGLLFESAFGVNDRQLALLEDVVMVRWCTSHLRWDEELSTEDWIACGVTPQRFNSLVRSRLLKQGTNGYGFADRVLSRLLLRKAIDKQLRNTPPANWWPACFDSERRALVDATLGSMPMRALKQAADRLSSSGQIPRHLLGPAEALFVAIGKQLAKGKSLLGRMHEVGDLVLLHPTGASGEVWPWSRPVATIDQGFEWCSALWAWALCASSAAAHGKNWRLPDWATGTASKDPAWLNPRAGIYDGRRAVPQGTSLAFFVDVTSRWSDTIEVPPTWNVALLLRPALILRAICKSWNVDANWWRALIGQEWAEQSLLTMLDAIAEESKPAAAQHLWPSLVQWQRDERREGMNFTPTKQVLLHSCRPEAQKFSRILGWVAKHLHDAQVLTVLDEDGRRFLDDYPQWLLANHQLVLLRYLADRLPFPKTQIPPWDYFTPFLPDASDGVCWFLGDPVLGREAAIGIWNWAPSSALSLLADDDGPAAHATQLILMCPPAYLSAAVTTLKKRPFLLQQGDREPWVRAHLAAAGYLALDLLALL